MANKTILFNVDIETTAYIKKVRDAEINVANLKNQQDELYNSLESIGEQFGYNSKQYQQATNQLKAYDAQIKVATKDVTNANKQLEDQVRLNNAAEGSYEALYRQWKNAEIALKTQAGNMIQLADGTYKMTEQGKKAAAEVLKLKEGVLSFNASIKDGRLNVGNYTQSISDYFSKVQQATGGSSAFGNAIGGIGDAITNTSTAFNLLKTGVETIQGGFKTAKDSVSNFFSVTTSGNTFGTFNEDAQETVETITNIGDAGEDVGKKIGKGSGSAVTGLKAIAKGAAATGIGLLVLAVAGLINYFLSLQSVTDKLKGIMGAVGAVIDSISKSIFEIGAAIATFDLSRLANAFGGFFGNASKAAGAAMDLNDAKIELEKTDTANLALQDELNDKARESRLIADDKTKSDEERIKALEDAIDAETESLKIQKQREEQALAIAEAEVDLANQNGEATREQLKNLEELKIKVGDVNDEIILSEKKKLAETGKLRKSLQSETIAAQIGLLNNELKLTELRGKESFALQRRIAKEQLDAELLDTTKNDKQKELLYSNYSLKLAEIDKAQGDARLARQKELEQLTINNILDGQTREIAAIGFATQQKLDAIIKGTEQEKELRLRIAEEGAKEILAVAQKYAQQTQEERQAVLIGNQTIQQNEIDSEAAKQQELLKLQLSYIDTKQNKTEEDLLFQQNAAQQSLQIEEERLKRQLDLQLQSTGQRIANEKAYYDNLETQALQGGLSKEALAIRLAEIDKQRQDAALKTEQETGAQITATTNAINENRVQQTLTANQTIADNNAKIIQQQAALNEAVTSAITEGLGAINNVLSLNEANQKKFALLSKSIATAELIINLQREISGYWAGVGRDTMTGGFILGTASSAKATAQTVAASIRAAAGLAKIAAQKFETGGFTVGDAVKRYNPSVVSDFKGGFISSPTMWAGLGKMNLAGEAGTEYVSPNWQIKQAPHLFSALESWRKTGVRPFADGGFTTTTITQPLQQNAQLIESAIVRGFMAAPSPVVSVQEINDVQNRVATIESRTTL